MESNKLGTVVTGKVRQGARGVRKVKTGCATCKIRHKKCDEQKPRCTPCKKAGWKCDFVVAQCPTPSRPPSFINLSEYDSTHFSYFRAVCAPEFAIFFQESRWADIVLRASQTDDSFRRIALAIGALTRNRYERHRQQQYPVDEYALSQYNLAIRELRMMNSSPQNLFRIVIASIALITLEFLLENYNRVQFHLDSAMAMLGAIHIRFEPETTTVLQALAYVQDMVSSPYWSTVSVHDALDVCIGAPQAREAFSLAGA